MFPISQVTALGELLLGDYFFGKNLLRSLSMGADDEWRLSFFQPPAGANTGDLTCRVFSIWTSALNGNFAEEVLLDF